jgi:hypothetical protein
MGIESVATPAGWLEVVGLREVRGALDVSAPAFLFTEDPCDAFAPRESVVCGRSPSSLSTLPKRIEKKSVSCANPRAIFQPN